MAINVDPVTLTGSAIYTTPYGTYSAASTVGSELAKIDQVAASGLRGGNNSLSYRVAEIERHFHNWERWIGSASSLFSADDVAGLSITSSSVPFVIDAGNDTWGNWLLISGSTDTPLITGMTKYDLHKIMFVDVERDNSTHFIQFAFGASTAALISSGSYTEIVYKPQATNTEEIPYPFITRRQNAGTKCWARVRAVGADTGTVSFFVGIHEYEG